MKPGRNDLCPCGSGKKYKHCCAERDAKAGPALRVIGAATMNDVFAASAATLRRAMPWEGEVTPVPASIADDPAARPAAVLLAAGDQILHADFIAHPPSEAAGVAAVLGAAVDDIVARGAKAPTRLRVRHKEVAVALAPLLAPRGIRVETSPSLPTLDDFAGQMRQQMGGFTEPAPAVSMPHSWAAWDLPEQTVAELFAAAAEFHAAEPWMLLENEQVFDLIMPGMHRWVASVLGNGGQQFGLVLYESENDFLRTLEALGSSDAFSGMRSAVLSLSFDVRADLPKVMQREIARAGWKVDGPRGYPLLWTMNTIGGGISFAQASDLTMALGAVRRFVAAHARLLGTMSREREVIQWADEPTGVLVRFDDRDDSPPALWLPVVSLSPCLAEGEHADAQALCTGESGDAGAARDARIVERFGDAERAAGAPEARLARDLRNVELFVEMMHGHQGICLPAVTEFDLRVFLYDLFPRKVRMELHGADSMRASLRRFSEYLAARETIVYPWARAILRDKFAFEERWSSFPGGFWWDAGVDEWIGELYADLDARVLLPSNELTDIGAWGATMGPDEARLYAELQRQALVWRDEAVADGERKPPAVRAEVARRQREWERRPQARFEGRSVIEAVRRERERAR